ncbi:MULTISPECIES: hypothetical protein [unclassified Streptomyces]|uniref:hypothetical protein n=1 Tax=unclassified Streptomyces TaxID=2593676 RepID=UPI002DD9CCB2|nr:MULTISPECIES: hypothetical protein [unclassified Streptomyces]WSC39038.1 hypothetical protein OHA08_28000 [Streptomyces sp. NBC_01763]WSC53833.1 hypothetical protein OG808_17105 [Streptomyces sp. NBC_01761]WSF84671.1 hypothetical protein OIE70_17195 [Streptomyces sp. NBC_01744]
MGLSFVRQDVCQVITSYPTGCDDRISRCSTPMAVICLKQCRSLATRSGRTTGSGKATVPLSYHLDSEGGG